MRRWRNWYTHYLEVVAGAIPWRFKSSPAHKMVGYTSGTDDIIVRATGTLSFRDKEYRCALGKGGVRNSKAEGDGATPVGCFPLREVYYRADKIEKPDCPFTTHAISKQDAWCDDPADPHYNTHITVGEGVTESLWRDDDLYDVVVVLGYNDNPPVPGKGSAIFMHVAREGYTPTAGCIALARNDVLEILKNTSPGTRVCITE